MRLPSYPKVYALGHRAVRDLFDGPVTVQEQIDGSQFSFGVLGGELLMRSKGAVIHPEAPPKLFANAVGTVNALFHGGALSPGCIYRGEVLDEPKHNVLAYDRVPSGNVILFDVDEGTECYASHEWLVRHADALALEHVPLLSEGEFKSFEGLAQLLEMNSLLGGVKVEGIVVKNYNRFGPDKKCLMGKFVRKEFKETHRKEWAGNSGKDILTLIVEELRTTARFEKAVQHLRDEDRLEGSPRDIGALIKELQRDVRDECADIIKDRLFNWAWESVRRRVTAGLPEWYKERLARGQFGGEDESL